MEKKADDGSPGPRRLLRHAVRAIFICSSRMGYPTHCAPSSDSFWASSFHNLDGWRSRAMIKNRLKGKAWRWSVSKLVATSSCSFVAAVIFLGVAAGAVNAATLHVANNGSDNDTCGAPSGPCRSISRAITNAIDGDTVVVGPGRYGDLNGNGTFEPGLGEEAAEVSFGCICMIKVNKSLTLKSTDGAGATVLDVGGADVRGAVIDANGVVFGERRHGFTIVNSRREALLLGGSTENVTLAGNVAIRNGTNGNDAFFIQGSGHTVSDNEAINNARSGFGIHGSGHAVSNNVAISNLQGFEVDNGVFTGNVANANRTHGFVVNGSGVEIRRNIIVGNGELGIRIFNFSA